MRKLFLRRNIQAPPIDHMAVAFFDTHLETKDGQIEFTPAYRVAKQFCQDMRPEIGVMGGDWLELAYLSKFTKDTPLLVEGRRYQQDLEVSRVELEAWRKCFKQMEFLPGNHDDRITRYVEKFPLFEGRMGIRQDYNLDELGIGWTDFNDVLSVGKLNFTHGWSWCQYHAAWHHRKMGDHLFYGHVHDHQVYCAPVRAKRQPFMTMSLGCLGNLNPIWKRNRPNDWLNGIGVFEVAASGNFSPFFVPIIDGELSYGGYTWKA
jgi:hypothetical protein